MTENPAALVAVMAIMTALLRFLPFFIFTKNTPEYVSYLGRTLPQAIIGMLVIYCLKDISFENTGSFAPELIASLLTAAIQAIGRNSLAAILAGTLIYMLLIRTLF